MAMQSGASKRRNAYPASAMRAIRRAATLLSFAVLLTVARPAAAQFYRQHNLVSDLPGVADLQDDSLVN